MINNGLIDGIFPNSEKLALIKPKLKNYLDLQHIKSYRPVSNLTFLSKMIEMAVLEQLNEHLHKCKELLISQSVYQKIQPTETML